MFSRRWQISQSSTQPAEQPDGLGIGNNDLG
jgi:hypothetical protein